MKTIVEYGVRGGTCAETTLPSIKQGQELAANLTWVLSNGKAPYIHCTHGGATYWRVTKSDPRAIWQSETHYVALSLLDGVPRGPAAPALSKLP